MHSLIDYFKELCLDFSHDKRWKQQLSHCQTRRLTATTTSHPLDRAFINLGGSLASADQASGGNQRSNRTTNGKRLSTIIEEQPKRMQKPAFSSAGILIGSLSVSCTLLVLLLFVVIEIRCQTIDSQLSESSLQNVSAAAQAAIDLSDDGGGGDHTLRRSDPSDERRQGRDEKFNDDDWSSSLAAINEESMITKQPRQQFKVYLGPTSASKSKFKGLKSNQASQSPSERIRLGNLYRRNSNSIDLTSGAANQSSNSIGGGGDDGGRQPNMQKQTNPKKISGATLKKLLNQTLPKYLSSNGTNLSPNKSSNFKFVFIQRATAPPSPAPPTNSTSATTTTTTTTKRITGGDSKSTSEESNRAPQATGFKSPSHLQTLATSVSKQLANSLFYTNSVATDSTNSNQQTSGSSTQTTPKSSIIAPSISLLAAHLASAATPSTTRKPKTNSKPIKISFDSSSGTAGTTSAVDEDKTSSQPYEIKRLNSGENGAFQNKKQSNASKTTRPSKIYNLPVKFVSNGQPNSVVFHTLKEHFATIRRLQMSGGATNGSKMSGKTMGKKRKDHHQSKLKGLNSRLIYLPLKYLSNARPHMIISPKAIHKSRTTTSSLVRSSDES